MGENSSRDSDCGRGVELKSKKNLLVKRGCFIILINKKEARDSP